MNKESAVAKEMHDNLLSLKEEFNKRGMTNANLVDKIYTEIYEKGISANISATAFTTALALIFKLKGEMVERQEVSVVDGLSEAHGALSDRRAAREAKENGLEQAIDDAIDSSIEA